MTCALTFDRLERLLSRFDRFNVALVGDLFLDRYLEIDESLDEPSIETGLTAYQVTRVRNSPGALGTVMSNLAALGVGKLSPVTVIGDDGHGDDLLRSLTELPVIVDGIVRDTDRLTPTYTKPLRQDETGAWKELNRLDVRTCQPLGEDTLAQLLSRLKSAFHQADGLIVLDQVCEDGLGVIHPQVRAALADLARQQPDKLVFIDSRAHLGRFDFGVLKGNRAEVLRAADISDDDLSVDAVTRAASTLAQRTGRCAFATMGEEGILVAHPQGETERVAAIRVEGPIDIVGAGDSVTAAMVASLLAGASEREAAEAASLAASITIEQLGTTGVAKPEQVLQRWRDGLDQSRSSAVQ